MEGVLRGFWPLERAILAVFLFILALIAQDVEKISLLINQEFYNNLTRIV